VLRIDKGYLNLTDIFDIIFLCAGTMKCLLNGVLEQRDTVCMNLFKRTYPKWPTRYFPLSE